MEDGESGILQYFRISGLHGYKDVEIEFRSPSRIVIAENGSGKTTVLSALHSFLSQDFLRLRQLNFVEIECKLHGDETPLILKRDSISREEIDEDSALRNIASTAQVSVDRVIRLLRSGRDYQRSSIYHNVYRRSPYGRSEVAELFESAALEAQNVMADELREIEERISQCLRSLEVLYLPTYRRVEAPLRRRKRRSRSEFESWSGHYDEDRSDFEPIDIRYGLADVQDRLTDLVQEISKRSNFGYRQISASIIDELMSAQGQLSLSNPLPDLEPLKLFLSRVDQQQKTAGRSDALDKLYESNALDDPGNETLRYFLSKLTSVVNETMELESNIETFVARVNDYLVMSSDEKHFMYDSARMEVAIRNAWTQEEISMDALSSGEKQVVSLFSYLYLYPTKKIILIDEPELSLSIDWQRRLLPDILKAPTCRQLLAITHSPFIFDNELDPIAGPMKIHRYDADAT